MLSIIKNKMRLDAVFPNRFHLIPKPWYRPKDVRSPSQIPRVKLLYWIHTPRGSPTYTDTHTHPRPTLLLIYSTLRSDRGFSAPTEGISLVWLITPHSDTEGLGQGHPSKAEMHAWETIPEEKQRSQKELREEEEQRCGHLGAERETRQAQRPGK